MAVHPPSPLLLFLNPIIILFEFYYKSESFPSPSVSHPIFFQPSPSLLNHPLQVSTPYPNFPIPFG